MIGKYGRYYPNDSMVNGGPGYLSDRTNDKQYKGQRVFVKSIPSWEENWYKVDFCDVKIKGVYITKECFRLEMNNSYIAKNPKNIPESFR